MAEPQWHCYFDRTQDGPLAEAVLTRRFGERLVPLHALVWSEAWRDDAWRPAREVDIFRRAATGPLLRPQAAAATPTARVAAAAPAGRAPAAVRPASVNPGPRQPIPAAGARVGSSPSLLPARRLPAAAAQVAQVVLPPPGPWARFWARLLDLAVGGNVLLALFVLPFVPELPPWGYIAQAFVGPLCWMALETVLLNLFGTTPGKWAFDIQVQTPGGDLPGYWQAVRRCGSVFVLGLGAGVAPFVVLGMAVAYNQLTQEGQTAWDRDAGLTVVCRGSGWLGWSLLTVALVAGLWVLVTV